MDQIVEFLSQPIVGSVIGILGILIGAFISVFFYFRSKNVSKPYYTIENTKLIDLSIGEIPSSVQMKYNGENIFCLNKTVLRFWNAGRKPIRATDMVPEYIEMRLGDEKEKNVQIISIEVEKSRKQTIVTNLIIHENRYLRFGFNFLEKGDQIVISIVHTATGIPNEITGYVVGIPDGFVNVSERQIELQEMMDIAFSTYDGLIPNVIKALAKMLIKYVG